MNDKNKIIRSEHSISEMPLAAARSVLTVTAWF